MERDEIVRKGNKLLLISACVIVPVLISWFAYMSRSPQPQPVQQPQYEEFDSTVWYPKKIKNMHIEKYADHTDYLMGFEDGTRSNVYWNFYENHKIGDSVVIGETQTFRRLIK